MNPGQQIFGTQEGLLAFSLYLSGCELADHSEICKHVYNPEILSKLGFKGEKLWESAQKAWANRSRGHVEFSFVLTPRTAELIKTYREQRKEIDNAMDAEGKDVSASVVILKIMQSVTAGAMLPDEAILRMTCVIGKIRSSFMNAYKETVPWLTIPEKGKTERFETTATTHDAKGNSRIVPAHGVRKPGYKQVRLDATPETLKKMGFA